MNKLPTLTRRSFLRNVAGSTSFFLASRNKLRATATSDEDIMAECSARIEKHRQGSGTVLVRDSTGKPIPGARVRIEQLRHAFLFGCNFFMFGRCKDPNHEEQYRERFAALLNYATLGFYWGAYEPNRGKPHYDYTDKVVGWCREHHIICKGHPLAWDHPASSPKWLSNDLAEVQALSTARVRDIVTRFKDGIDRWDVVNEPTDLTRFKNPMNTWATKMGASAFTEHHLRIARGANPQACLLVNDYRTDPAFYEILDALREQGKPMFDAIGIQSHMHDSGWPLRKVWSVCDSYSRLKVPLHFTETTIVSGPRKGPGENWDATTAEGEKSQADYAAKFYTALFAHPAVEAVTWWDFSDQGAWQGAAAGWLRKDMSPKPVYDRLQQLIKKEWWTNTEGTTTSQGEFAGRAFYGTHRISARLSDGGTVSKDVHWSRNAENRFELRA